MTGGLVVDGHEALDPLLYGPGVFGDQWVRARIHFEDGGALLFHDPRRFGSLELAPDENKLGPDALDVTRAELASALWVPPNRATAAPAQGPTAGPGAIGRHRQSLGGRDPLAGGPGPPAPRCPRRRGAQAPAQDAAGHVASAGPAGGIAHGRAAWRSATREGAVPSTAPSSPWPRSVVAPPTGVRSTSIERGWAGQLIRRRTHQKLTPARTRAIARQMSDS